MTLKLIVLLLTVTLAGCAGWTEEDWALRNAQIAQMNQNQSNTSQQTFNMAMGMVNQTQVGNLSATDYARVQRSDGVWVYCIRTSSYTVNCRSQ